MPNREVIEKWVDALESGEYEQGTGYLHREHGKDHVWCCLGVLCDLAVNEKVIFASTKEAPMSAPTGSLSAHTYGEEHLSGALPLEVQSWVGLDSGLPVVRVPSDDEDIEFEFQPLSHLNDIKGWTFPEIAAAIRSSFL